MFRSIACPFHKHSKIHSTTLISEVTCNNGVFFKTINVYEHTIRALFSARHIKFYTELTNHC